jgi:hypothetical protein
MIMKAQDRGVLVRGPVLQFGGGYRSALLPRQIGTVNPGHVKFTRPVELIENGPIRVDAVRCASRPWYFETHSRMGPSLRDVRHRQPIIALSPCTTGTPQPHA